MVKASLIRFVSVLMMMLVIFTVPAYANTETIYDVYQYLSQSDQGANQLPDWQSMTDVILEMKGGEDGSGEIPDLTDPANEGYKNFYKASQILVSSFETEQNYNRWKAEWEKVAVYDQDQGLPVPVSNYTVPTDGEQRKFDKAANKFNQRVGATAVGNVADQLFATDNWNPDNNFMTPIMEWVYYIVNTAFSVISQLFLWAFLFQTAADALYIGIPFMRKWIGPFSARGGGGGGMGGMGGSGGGEGQFFLPVCSDEAEQAVNNGESGGALGAGNSTGKSNKVLFYIKKRFAVIMFLAVYLILVFAGWWPQFISIFAGLVINAITYVLQFLGLM